MKSRVGIIITFLAMGCALGEITEKEVRSDQDGDGHVESVSRFVYRDERPILMTSEIVGRDGGILQRDHMLQVADTIAVLYDSHGDGTLDSVSLTDAEGRYEHFYVTLGLKLTPASDGEIVKPSKNEQVTNDHTEHLSKDLNKRPQQPGSNVIKEWMVKWNYSMLVVLAAITGTAFFIGRQSINMHKAKS